MENEAQGVERAGKAKGNGRLFTVIMLVAFIVAALYLYTQKAVAPVISIEGVEIKLKDSTSVLVDAGFEIKGGKTLEGKSWSHGFTLEKDGKSYAMLTLYNTSNEEKPVSECRIGQMTVFSFRFSESDSFLIDGVAPFEMDADKLRKAFKIKEDDTLVSTDIGYVHITFSDYNEDTDMYEKVYFGCDFEQSYK